MKFFSVLIPIAFLAGLAAAHPARTIGDHRLHNTEPVLPKYWKHFLKKPDVITSGHISLRGPHGNEVTPAQLLSTPIKNLDWYNGGDSTTELVPRSTSPAPYMPEETCPAKDGNGLIHCLTEILPYSQTAPVLDATILKRKVGSRQQSWNLWRKV